MVEKISLLHEAEKVTELFEYRRIATLNGQMLNVLQARDRTLDFHTHELADEMFYIIDGEMDIEFDDGLQHLCAGELIIVPAGTWHRPVVKGLVKCLLIETEGTLNAGNTGGKY